MLTPGSPAPVLELEDTAGRPWRLSENLGANGALLYFTRSTSCPICNRHVRDLLTRRGEFDAAGLRIHIAVPEDRERALGWKTRHGIPFTVLVGSTGTPHASIGLPRTVFGTMQQSGSVLVDADGIIRHAHGATMPVSGYDKKGIAAAIEAMLSRTGT
ncbi:redoxin domain-containing protein [Nocardia cyriacigeorgica]|uniref:peroxiredoxin family protein n=1 Tax=Nocardia cyriacigeorgica TaxID=135487 RepID=UPI0018937844|nr:redoxin domain-containing protein [Nocardia cyriacigeorgica]MBF6514923.1 redoxin domain-containing protein [Nocardia cyriacigeorgica]